MQVCLPEDLYQQVKARELRRQDLLSETESYLVNLRTKLGEPSPGEQARAEAWARKAIRQPAEKGRMTKLVLDSGAIATSPK